MKHLWTSSKLAFWVSVMAGVLAMTGVIHITNLSRHVVGRDYYQVWLPARAYAEPMIQDLYAAQDQEILGRLAMISADNPDISSVLRHAIIYSNQTYPHHLAGNFTPTMLMVYAPFVSVDYKANLHGFNYVSLAMYLLGIVLLSRTAGLNNTTMLLAMAALLWWFSPVRNDTVDSNVNRLQLGIIGLSLWLSQRKQYMLGAALIGMIIMFKPNMALFPVLMLTSPVSCKQWRRCGQQIGGVLLGIATSYIAPVILFGQKASWGNWFLHMKQLHMEAYAIEVGNIATARLILESTGLNMSVLLAVVLTALTIGVIAIAARRGHDTDLFAAGMAAVIAIAASQLAWPHYSVLLIPLLIYVFQICRSRPTLLIILVPAYLIIAERLLRTTASWMTNMQYGYLLGLAMLALAVIAAKNLMRQAPTP